MINSGDSADKYKYIILKHTKKSGEYYFEMCEYSKEESKFKVVYTFVDINEADKLIEIMLENEVIKTEIVKKYK